MKTFNAKIEVNVEKDNRTPEQIAQHIQGVYNTNRGWQNPTIKVELIEDTAPRPNVVMWQKPSPEEREVIDAAIELWKMKDLLTTPSLDLAICNYMKAKLGIKSDHHQPTFPPNWGKVKGTDAFDPPPKEPKEKRYKIGRQAWHWYFDLDRKDYTQSEIMTHFEEVEVCPTCGKERPEEP